MSKHTRTLSKSQLDYSDVALLKPRVVARKLHEGGVNDGEVPALQCQLAREALSSNAFLKNLPGLKESALDVIKILITARLANSCKNLKPTIMSISDFSKISRNKVSPMVSFLELCDLVGTRSQKREQLVFPTIIADIYIDIISGNLKEEYSDLKNAIQDMKEHEPAIEHLALFENLETAFRLAESAYDTNTMNHQIMEELHAKSMKLLVESKEGKLHIDDLEEFSNTILHIIKVKEKARKMGLEPVILEKTDEELGRAKVYRVK
jgi:hypothetical protein